MLDRDIYRHSRNRPVFIEWDGAEVGGGPYATESGAFPYMTFDGSTRLDVLPTNVESTWGEFIASIQANEPNTQQCWLTASLSRITNVNEYVNLRRQPDFSAPIVRQVPLGEQVQGSRPDNLSAVGDQRTYDTCVNACQAFSRDRDDRRAAEQAQECINDNILWYEIIDARGNRGWVSRRFLAEVQ